MRKGVVVAAVVVLAVVSVAAAAVVASVVVASVVVSEAHEQGFRAPTGSIQHRTSTFLSSSARQAFPYTLESAPQTGAYSLVHAAGPGFVGSGSGSAGSGSGFVGSVVAGSVGSGSGLAGSVVAAGPGPGPPSAGHLHSPPGTAPPSVPSSQS
ncbi:hypothetical protein THAOC_20399, partial [Thalassiosira oceanica]